MSDGSCPTGVTIGTMRHAYMGTASTRPYTASSAFLITICTAAAYTHLKGTGSWPDLTHCCPHQSLTCTTHGHGQNDQRPGNGLKGRWDVSWSGSGRV